MELRKNLNRTSKKVGQKLLFILTLFTIDIGMVGGYLYLISSDSIWLLLPYILGIIFLLELYCIFKSTFAKTAIHKKLIPETLILLFILSSIIFNIVSWIFFKILYSLLDGIYYIDTFFTLYFGRLIIYFNSYWIIAFIFMLLFLPIVFFYLKCLYNYISIIKSNDFFKRTATPRLLKNFKNHIFNNFIFLRNICIKKYKFNRYFTFTISIMALLNISAIVLICVFTNLSTSLGIIILTLEAIVCIFYVKHICMFKDLCRILDFIEMLSNGEMNRTLSLSRYSKLYGVSNQLNQISHNLKISIEKQIKNEKLKVDLITNVSHDLKTPLTSIICYIDLLKKDDSLSQEAKDYVEILAHKSTRLKDMVQDVFELSKATSKTSNIELKIMDMNKLILQTIAEMDDYIQETDIPIKLQLSNENMKFLGDSIHMYRVFQNLIQNALKYSLKGTRIFINTSIEDNEIIAIIKNIAMYEMNFTEDMIVERFARGDIMRSSEGNGLGLAIAKSFTEACGGKFQIVIDGDLFKAIVIFPLANNDLVS